MSPQSERAADGDGTVDVTWHIITVAYNSAADLRAHWGGIDLPDGVRWTVVDNASDDDSVAVARDLGAVVITLAENVGFGAANNIGARSTISRYVVFANPDIEVVVGSLVQLGLTLDRFPDAVIAPQLLNADGSRQPSGRNLPTLSSKVLNRLPSASRRTYQITADDCEQRYVSWAIGAAVAMTSATFEDVHWDERFFVYYEDSDLGLRAWSRGHPVVLDGTVRWVHGWARATTGLDARAWRLELASMAKFYTRYPHLLLPVGLAALFHPERGHIGARVEADGPAA